MENKNKKSLLKIRSFQDGIFVGLCSAGLLGYSLYHHHFDRNTSEWKLSPFLFPVLISVFGLLLTISLIADARREQKTAEDAGAKPAFIEKSFCKKKDKPDKDYFITGGWRMSIYRGQIKA